MRKVQLSQLCKATKVLWKIWNPVIWEVYSKNIDAKLSKGWRDLVKLIVWNIDLFKFVTCSLKELVGLTESSNVAIWGMERS